MRDGVASDALAIRLVDDDAPLVVLGEDHAAGFGPALDLLDKRFQ
jgi:hypothetical protein